MTPPEAHHARRALVVGDADARPLEESLVALGYETLRATGEEVAGEVERLAPDVLLLVSAGGEEARARAAALVRRVRSEARTFALPLVLLFEEDERGLRNAALNAGVDDYLPLATPPAELRARLDALFWRAEAGRRSAPSALDQRTEIDNFLLLLDAVREDTAGGRAGTLALVGASREGAGGERLMSEAHGFFKLNLRRADSVAFYGPTILFAYLPGRTCQEAQATLDRLREEFSASGGKVVAGLASFPADGDDVERLIEEAEARLEAARAQAPHGCAGVGAASEEGARLTPAASAQDEQRARESRLLEAIDASAASLARAGSRPEAAPRASAAGPHRLLLAVSDSARMAQLNQLIRSAGYEVRAAFDARQALSLLRIERPDLLLADQDLNDMDGVEMLTRLARQQGGRLAQPSLLLLPREAGEGARREALEIGARAVVSLPYNPEELLDLIRDACGRGVR